MSGVPARGTSSTSGRVAVGDDRIEYCWFGGGDGDDATIVLLHEGLGSVSAWRDFPSALATATGRPVLAYSRPGYGASSRRPAPWPCDFMHHEAGVVLPRLLAALGIERPLLVGHSDGGSIALLHAAAGHAVEGLALMAPHVFVEQRTLEGIRAAVAAWQAGDLARGLERHHGANARDCFEGWSGAWLSPQFRDWNIEAAAAAVSVPMLLIQGAEDEYGTLAQIEAIRRRARGPVRQVVLEACGHAPHRDQPERALAAIAAFARELAAEAIHPSV